MIDLIERLERATGPDWELDAAIRVRVIKGAFPDESTEQRMEYARKFGQHYTESIDDALTLVPSNGRLLELGQWQDNGQPDGWFAQVTKWIKDGEHGWIDQGFSYGVPEYGATKKPPLAPNGAIALCIAALKARALSQQQGGK